MSRRIVTRAVSGLIALGVVLGLAAPASAHVTVKSTEAVQGGYAKITVRVPTESDTASTTKVQIALPQEHPLASVRVKPTAGWTATLKREKLPEPITSGEREITEVVTEITWVAAPGAGVKPGEFQEFDVSVGRLPEVESLTFKAVQTYSDGKVVRWIEERAEGAKEEPEFPAAVLMLTPAGDEGERATNPSLAAARDDSGSTKDDSGLALALGTAGLVAGLAGLTLGALALRAVRRPTSTAGADAGS